jgi:DNA-binding MarR family transcriptional regulator
VHSRALLKRSVPADPVIVFLRTLWALDHALQSHSKRMKAAIGVTGPQRLVIRMVALKTGTSPSQLARLLHFHKSTVSIIVRSLERAGLVKRSKSQRDGRSITLRLTPKGMRVARRTQGTVEAVVRRVLSRTPTGDVEIARHVLEALGSAFS